ncbi:hypothetical protein LTR53_003614 [Teratosphaeriaceae sp. CCFEE 6253]|nr:hypothetical protein LTR53_003614 [Teratosphaeriaceae sp. CCFEE 6253]
MAHDPNGMFSCALRMLAQDNTWIDPCAYRTGAPGVQQVPSGVITHHLGAQGSWSSLDLPVPVSSGRMYFVTDGELEFATIGPPTDNTCAIQEPSGLNPSMPSAQRSWGFMEFSYRGNELYVNPTLVDFVGTPLSVRLETSDGNLDAKGLPADIVQLMCDGLAAKARDEPGVQWDKLCMKRPDGSALRVLSPSHYKEADAPMLDTYWEQHVEAVWDSYRSRPLTVETQGEHGSVQCQVRGDVLFCGGETFAKPCSSDIFGCNSGPFANAGTSLHRAVASRLCAAFHRSTLLIAGGDKQPCGGRDKYYTTTPSNWYSALVHAHAIDGHGYAFPYDDITASGRQDLSGTLSHTDPQKLVIGIGGPLPA